MQGDGMISIIMPAHNEMQVIRASLEGLMPGVESGEFELIVVCNGCTDSTTSVVRSVSDKIICIEVDRPSKTHALNVGDATAHYFPRVYMDADIQLSSDGIKSMAVDIRNRSLLAVSPCMKMKLAHSSWMVKAYYDVWSGLPYCQAGMIGVGVYVLSEEGRSKFGAFPDIIADDGFVRLQFSDAQRSAVAGVDAVVTAPSGLFGLIKIKTRSRLGEYELKSKFPALFQHDQKNYGEAVLAALQWSTVVNVMIYFTVNIMTRIRAKIQMRSNKELEWERDESSRLL